MALPGGRILVVTILIGCYFSASRQLSNRSLMDISNQMLSKVAPNCTPEERPRSVYYSWVIDSVNSSIHYTLFLTVIKFKTIWKIGFCMRAKWGDGNHPANT